MEELSIIQQIEVLKLAIKIFNKKLLYHTGLCACIKDALIDLKYDTNYSHNIPIEYIPSFNRKNAFYLARMYHYKLPENDIFWWKDNNRTSRIKFLNALISELTKQL